jgi:xylan 1,4-beta-xylosidase
LRQFLEHCSTGVNAVTGAHSVPLDFITFHAKGKPEIEDGHVRMGLAQNLSDVENGFLVVADFPKLRGLPIVLSESDPEGCAACGAARYPQNAYRNGTLYPAYTATSLKNILDLAAEKRVNLAGMLTWAFEFEDQPYFAGFRTLATNGLDKPILNLFRMLGMMDGERVAVTSSASIDARTIIAKGVRERPDVDAMAAISGHTLTVLLWNYQDDENGGETQVHVTLRDMPGGGGRALIEHYRIDGTHSNAYTAWQRLGSPQHLTPQQKTELRSAGELQQLESPRWVGKDQQQMSLNFELPIESISLLRISW